MTTAIAQYAAQHPVGFCVVVASVTVIAMCLISMAFILINRRADARHYEQMKAILSGNREEVHKVYAQTAGCQATRRV